MELRPRPVPLGAQPFAAPLLGVRVSYITHSFISAWQQRTQNQFTKDPKSVDSELHLSLTLALLINSVMIMGQNGFGNVRVFWKNNWVLD